VLLGKALNGIASTFECLFAVSLLRYLDKYMSTVPKTYFKGELGELEFYLKKIPLLQQKFLVVSVLSNSPWLPKNLKKGPK